MKKIFSFIILFCGLVLIFSATAAPTPSRDELVNGVSSSPEVDRALRTPMSGSFKDPGILPCPDQSQYTKMRDLAKLENHSRDCKPRASGTLMIDGDRPEGEVRGSEVPAQFE
ncbi:hypothetical protein [Bdellovibrio sp. HCB209]|uniref:hypothetical protein n=1 Tax=Bdellovibrio sp. HCB209 TaxID=3394354 RepID=UPI0039B62B0C